MCLITCAVVLLKCISSMTVNLTIIETQIVYLSGSTIIVKTCDAMLSSLLDFVFD